MKAERKLQYNNNYTVTLLIGIVILMVAIMGPQVLFRIQDDYRMGRTWHGQRNSLDMEALNNSYESLRNRMEALAYGLSVGEKYYAPGTYYDVTAESYRLTEDIFEDSPFFIFQELGMISLDLSGVLEKYGYDIVELKKYVIYNDSIEDGIASVDVMAWYMELKSEDDFRIKLLADTESNTIYYMQCTYERDMSIYEGAKNVNIDLGTEKLYLSVDSFMLEALLPEYWNNYYEANEMQGRAYYLSDFANANGIDLRYDMDYDSKCLTWEFGMNSVKEKENIVIYIGIKEIGEMISEFD